MKNRHAHKAVGHAHKAVGHLQIRNHWVHHIKYVLKDFLMIRVIDAINSEVSGNDSSTIPYNHFSEL